MTDLPSTSCAPEPNQEQSLFVYFETKQEQYAIPGAAIGVPESITPEGLNGVVSTIIRQGRKFDELPVFQFLVGGQLLIGSLRKRLEEAGIPLETRITVEFFESELPPKPEDSLQHDDWVSAVESCGQWLLTGCYDNTVQLWTASDLESRHCNRAHTLTIPAHHAPVKAVTWLQTDGPTKMFVSASMDQTAIVWAWNSDANSIDRLWECRGHSQSVECVGTNEVGTRFATGSWDKTLKIWSAVITEESDDADAEEVAAQRQKVKKTKKKTPLLTLGGHGENVGGVAWMDDHSLVTSSWDHTIRLWDADIGGMTSQIGGNTAFFGLSYSPLNHTIVAGCADRFIKLYDPRSNEGDVVKMKFISHKKWVPSVKWSKTKDKVFVSGGFDKAVKMWDCRSPKAPLYDLTGHEDKVMNVDWSYPSHIASGSADCTAKVYAANS